MVLRPQLVAGGQERSRAPKVGVKYSGAILRPLKTTLTLQRRSAWSKALQNLDEILLGENSRK
jgi:hypothetical protein